MRTRDELKLGLILENSEPWFLAVREIHAPTLHRFMSARICVDAHVIDFFRVVWSRFLRRYHRDLASRTSLNRRAAKLPASDVAEKPDLSGAERWILPS